jgi:hypothetical protein
VEVIVVVLCFLDHDERKADGREDGDDRRRCLRGLLLHSRVFFFSRNGTRMHAHAACLTTATHFARQKTVTPREVCVPPPSCWTPRRRSIAATDYHGGDGKDCKDGSGGVVER